MAKKVTGFIIKHLGFLCSLIVVFGLTLIRFSEGIIQQDNYTGYATNIHNINSISKFDSRLFPGLPFLIFVVSKLTGNITLSGYMINVFCFTGCYFLLYKLTKSKYSFFPLMFPPIMLDQSTLVATEFPLYFLILSSIYLFKKNPSLAFFFAGLSVPIKLVGITLFPTIIFNRDKKVIKTFLTDSFFFSIPIIFFLLFNSVHYGNIFHQTQTYGSMELFNWSIVQIFYDIQKAIAIGNLNWYRILVSFLIYLALYFVLLIYSLKQKSNLNETQKLTLEIIGFISFFVFCWSFVPFIPNFARYVSPVFILFWIILYDKFKNPIPIYLSIIVSIFVVLV